MEKNMDDLYGKKAKKYKLKYLKLKKEYIAKGGAPYGFTQQSQQQAPRMHAIQQSYAPRMHTMQQPYAPRMPYHPMQQPTRISYHTNPYNTIPHNTNPYNTNQQSHLHPIIQNPHTYTHTHSGPIIPPQPPLPPLPPQPPSNTKFIDTGLYSCVLYPPIKFNYSYSYYNPTNNNLDIYNEKYIGKILKIFWYIFELKQYNKIIELKIISKHIPKLIFNGIINKSEIFRHKDASRLRICLNNKQVDENQVGYIITDYVGETIENLLKKKIPIDINQFLTSLIGGINTFIRKIRDENIIHSDLHLGNLTLYKNDIVCFIDFGAMHNINVVQNYDSNKKSDPLIINNFYMNTYKNSPTTPFLLSYLHEYKKNRKSIINNQNIIIFYISQNLNNNIQFKEIRTIYNKILKYIQYINSKYSYKHEQHGDLICDINGKKYYCLFDKFIINYVTNLINTNYTKFNTDEDYQSFINSIAINVDIYSLSLAIYKLFDKIFDSNEKKDNNLKAVLKVYYLYIDALQNKINGPDGLIEKINEIIRLLKNV